ncbi:hypothetical protein CEXT_573371 [Caerostris extrusa]|uniref:Uncharacterized protein n=1 Tax=Caerostris extrusa TaxID=172846 RepID=A0AAV4XS98_CAEEX|nr:hypothetical protein CEXT_573371 [Caerostris extrusa]
MAAREPIRDQKQLHQKTGRSDISNYFPATSPADPVYQVVIAEWGTTVLFLDVSRHFASTARNSFLRRNLAANPKGNKTYLGTQLREDMAAREPIRA